MRGATDIAREARQRGATAAADLIWQMLAMIDDLLDEGDCRCEDPQCIHMRGRRIVDHRDEVDT